MPLSLRTELCSPARSGGRGEPAGRTAGRGRTARSLSSPIPPRAPGIPPRVPGIPPRVPGPQPGSCGSKPGSPHARSSAPRPFRRAADSRGSRARLPAPRTQPAPPRAQGRAAAGPRGAGSRWFPRNRKGPFPAPPAPPRGRARSPRRSSTRGGRAERGHRRGAVRNAEPRPLRPSFNAPAGERRSSRKAATGGVGPAACGRPRDAEAARGARPSSPDPPPPPTWVTRGTAARKPRRWSGRAASC